jgi:acetyl-CoA carboxylase biotin carboxyl carrier protein
MIDIRKLKELVKLMVGNDLTELDLRDPEEQVTLRRPNQWSAIESSPVAAAPIAAPAAVAAPAAPPVAPAAVAAAPAANDDAGLVAIPSPMVGTFYAAASPDAEAFIKVGDAVRDDTVVCMIEAMKIFNEIKADCSGTIERMCVANGDPVEFGQDLFMVRPA